MYLIPLPQMIQFAVEMNLIEVPVNPALLLAKGFCIFRSMAQLQVILFSIVCFLTWLFKLE